MGSLYNSLLDLFDFSLPSFSTYLSSLGKHQHVRLPGLFSSARMSGLPGLFGSLLRSGLGFWLSQLGERLSMDAGRLCFLPACRAHWESMQTAGTLVCLQDCVYSTQLHNYTNMLNHSSHMKANVRGIHVVLRISGFYQIHNKSFKMTMTIF